ncbi:MAG: hypothetical protein K0Q79_2222 [Flavipsychrobacter sp.]|jgi:hypothetical protein|nr:hypothetical protein [Flavipsychrobacter sp.]
MRGLYIILLAVFLISCGSEEESNSGKKETITVAIDPETGQPSAVQTPTATMTLPGPNDMTQFAIKEITGFYGGIARASNGTTNKGKRFYRIDISNSPILDSNVKITELNISNIAILFYKHISPEKDKFDEIQASITFGDGQKLVKTYTKEKLELVISKVVVITKIVGLLKAKNYDGLLPLMNDKSHIVYDKTMLVKSIERAEERLEPVKEFIPYGFLFILNDKKKELLHISGVLLRERGNNNEFSVDFDPSVTKEEILFLNYKL